MVKKGQAAMEFMMTYGWAILVVLIAIAALAFFGVLNPGGFFPNSCTVQSGVGCEDFKITQNGADLILVNGLGDDLESVTVSLTGCTDEGPYDWNDGDILDEDTDGLLTFVCTDNGDEGSRYEGDITISYTGSSGISHVMTGQIRSEVEA